MIVRRNFVATFVDLAKAPFCHRYFPFLSSKLTGCTRILCFTDDRHPTLSRFSERDPALPSVASAIGAVFVLQLFATLPVCTRRLSRLSLFGASLHFFDSYKTSFPLEVFAGEDHVNSFFFPCRTLFDVIVQRCGTFYLGAFSVPQVEHVVCYELIKLISVHKFKESQMPWALKS